MTFYTRPTMDVLKTMGKHRSVSYNGKHLNTMYTFDKFNKDDGGWREWTYEVVKTVFIITILKPYK